MNTVHTAEGPPEALSEVNKGEEKENITWLALRVPSQYASRCEGNLGRKVIRLRT